MELLRIALQSSYSIVRCYGVCLELYSMCKRTPRNIFRYTHDHRKCLHHFPNLNNSEPQFSVARNQGSMVQYLTETGIDNLPQPFSRNQRSMFSFDYLKWWQTIRLRRGNCLLISHDSFLSRSPSIDERQLKPSWTLYDIVSQIR